MPVSGSTPSRSPSPSSESGRANLAVSGSPGWTVRAWQQPDLRDSEIYLRSLGAAATLSTNRGGPPGGATGGRKKNINSVKGQQHFDYQVGRNGTGRSVQGTSHEAQQSIEAAVQDHICHGIPVPLCFRCSCWPAELEEVRRSLAVAGEGSTLWTIAITILLVP